MTKEPQGIRYEDLSDLLVKTIPDIQADYLKERSWWGGQVPGPHIIFGDGLNPYIDRLLQSNDVPSLHKVFEFIETLAEAKDARVSEVVEVTVCEYLGAERKRLDQARKYMRPVTLRMSERVESKWG